MNFENVAIQQNYRDEFFTTSAFACESDALTQELALRNEQRPIALKRAVVEQCEARYEEDEFNFFVSNVVGQILMSTQRVEWRSCYRNEVLAIQFHNADCERFGAEAYDSRPCPPQKEHQHACRENSARQEGRNQFEGTHDWIYWLIDRPTWRIIVVRIPSKSIPLVNRFSQLIGGVIQLAWIQILSAQALPILAGV